VNIFIICKSNFRRQSLNNFQNTKNFGDYKLYFLLGFPLFYLSKIFSFFKSGKFISLDGNPTIDEKKGINLWMGGTNFKIPNEYNNFKNNYTNMNSIFLSKQKIFQIYPLNIRSFKKKTPKIVFISEVNITKDINIINLWKKNKIELTNDFTKIDDIFFWKKFNFFNKKKICFSYYRHFKNLLRLEIVKKLSNKYRKNFLLVGSSWSNFGIKSIPSIFDRRIVANIYQGNICIDLGSKAGSLSLYPRSIDIIESGGILVQSKQNDADKIWKNPLIQNKFLFCNFKELFLVIKKILKNKNIMKKIYLDNNIIFQKSDLLIQEQFNNIFKSND
jgi:hypothetical protein